MCIASISCQEPEHFRLFNVCNLARLSWDVQDSWISVAGIVRHFHYDYAVHYLQEAGPGACLLKLCPNSLIPVCPVFYILVISVVLRRLGGCGPAGARRLRPLVRAAARTGCALGHLRESLLDICRPAHADGPAQSRVAHQQAHLRHSG